MITTTTFDIPGKNIEKCLGVVRGITVRVPSMVQGLSASIKSISGGKTQAFTDMCDEARNEAFLHMLEEAQSMGADAVIGVRYDTSTVVEIGTEFICYGTAVSYSII